MPAQEKGIDYFLICAYNSPNTSHELRQMEEGSQDSGCGCVYVRACVVSSPTKLIALIKDILIKDFSLQGFPPWHVWITSTAAQLLKQRQFTWEMRLVTF